jgi:glycosyltransferase involved in cell wall biosynthesis
MCAELVEELIGRGVKVTLIGAGRTGTSAEFVHTYSWPQADRLGQSIPEVVHAAALPEILATTDADVVHDHTLAGPLLADGRRIPTVVTAHGPVTGELGRYYRDISSKVHLVAISEAQRRAAPQTCWSATVHNAVRLADLPFRAEKEDFALFLGRMSPDKGLPGAIAAAQAAGLALRVAAKCSEPDEQEYFDREIAPLLTGGIEWLGEVCGPEKLDLLAAARCLLFPIRWEEPFGMVMIEAMGCGTPVVALRRGSVPEVIADGVTGLICDDPAQLPAALHRVDQLDPTDCREHVRRRFDVSVMAAGYERAYRTAVKHPRATEQRRDAGGVA